MEIVDYKAQYKEDLKDSRWVALVKHQQANLILSAEFQEKREILRGEAMR